MSNTTIYTKERFLLLYYKVRDYLTLHELLEWYSLEDIIDLEYSIRATEDLKRAMDDLWALWED